MREAETKSPQFRASTEAPLSVVGTVCLSVIITSRSWLPTRRIMTKTMTTVTEDVSNRRGHDTTEKSPANLLRSCAVGVPLSNTVNGVFQVEARTVQIGDQIWHTLAISMPCHYPHVGE